MSSTRLIPGARTTGFRRYLAVDRTGSDGFAVTSPLANLLTAEPAAAPFVALDGAIGLYLALYGSDAGAVVSVRVYGVMRHSFGADDYRYDMQLIGTLDGVVGDKKIGPTSSSKFCDQLTWTLADFGTDALAVYSVTATKHELNNDTAILFIPNVVNLYGVAFDIDMSQSAAPTSCNVMWSANV